MVVEMMVKWTELKLSTPNKSEDELFAERVISGMDTSAPKAEYYNTYSPMVFEMDDVARFNRSNDPKCTTIRFKDGDGYVILVKYEDFRDLYTECTGSAILSTIDQEDKPEDKPKKKKKGGDGEPPKIP